MVDFIVDVSILTDMQDPEIVIMVAILFIAAGYIAAIIINPDNDK
jgi:hypothetical protein